METFREFCESSEGKTLSNFIGSNSSRKSQRWAYLAGFCRGTVHGWHFAKDGATQEEYEKCLKFGKKRIWRSIKKFFDEWYKPGERS